MQIRNTKPKKIEGTCIKTGERKVWDSISATRKDGSQPPNIHRCLTGKVGTHRGYIWKLVEENE